MKKEITLRELRQILTAAHLSGEPDDYARVRDAIWGSVQSLGLSQNLEKPANAKAFVENLYRTRLIHPVRSRPADAQQQKYERFLLKYFRAALRCSDAALPRALREKAGMQDARLDELTAACFILLLQNARSSDWVDQYCKPLKDALYKALHEKIPGLPYPAVRWRKVITTKITEKDLQAAYNAMPAYAPLRTVADSTQTPLLRALLEQQCINSNDYLENARRFLQKKLAELDDTAAVRAGLKNGRLSLPEGVPTIRNFFDNWDDGLGLLEAPDRTEKKLEYRILRHIFFLLLGADEDIYGSQEDIRELMLQIGFSVGMRSEALDTFLKENQQPGLDYKGTELFYAYAADHWDTRQWMHACALQALYRTMCTLPEQKPAASRSNATQYYRNLYAAGHWSQKTPKAFLKQCRDDHLPWQHPGADAPALSEASSQLLELRWLLIDLDYRAASSHTAKENARYRKLRLGWQNYKYLRDTNSLAAADAASEKYAAFLQWDRLDAAPGREEPSAPGSVETCAPGKAEPRGKESRRRNSLPLKTITAFGPYYPATAYEIQLFYSDSNNSSYAGCSEQCGVFSAAASRALKSLQTGRWLPRDAFLQLLFLHFLVTYTPLPDTADEILKLFAQESEITLNSCRLLPYNASREPLLTSCLRTAAKTYLQALPRS